MTQRYGLLTELVDVDKVPAPLSFVSQPLGALLAKVRYRDLIAETSPDRGAGHYALTLITERIVVDLLGSGLKVVYFEPEQPADLTSEIPLSFDYRWPILKYAHAFDLASFPHTARAVFDILLDIVDISEREFIDGVVEALIDDPAPYQALIDKLKDWNANGGAPLSGLTLSNLPTTVGEAEHIVTQIKAANVDVFIAAFEAAVEDLSNIEQGLDNVAALFRRWLGGVSREEVEALLVPHFSVELKNVNMALEVPRSILVPLDVAGNVKGAPEVSRVRFIAGALRYDPRTGFAIDLNGEAKLDKSEIPGFGLTLEVSDVKVDLSEEADIPEVAADLRPAGFKGAYIERVAIGLPPRWFEAKNKSSASLELVGRNLLIGTGGLSGEIGLEAIDKDNASANTTLDFVLGPEPSAGARKGFTLGFSSFKMRFKQNALLESAIKGALTVPKFDADPVDIELYLDRDGDFEVTASIAAGHVFKFGDVFTYTARRLRVGKDAGRVFIDADGELSFENNKLLQALIEAPISLKGFRINSDGSFCLEGGSVPLPESAMLRLGPANIAVTAVHFGTHQQDYDGKLREYRYFGFDARVSVNPGGVDARGDGVKYYFTTDGGKFHHFIRIEGLGVDLVIPGAATKEQAILIIKGYLALKDPEYEGSLQFMMPQAQIAGGASMRYNTKYPAWIVDAMLELPAPIPLGATGLGLFGFRGLFGLRYIASKAAAGLNEAATWGDYYRASDKKGVIGLTVDKLSTPDADKTPAKTPLSIGAGVSLATAADDGKTFSSQLFLLASIPNLILLEGRFDVLAKKRVGLTGDDPPYYAYIALAPRHSFELGAGARYRVPKDTGATLDMQATLEAAYFFQNRSAWYLNVGTKAKPTTARVLSLFDAYSYLMLSAGGIEAGAGVRYDFSKKYGPVSVDVHAYLDVWVHISFERAQSGGGLALGGSLDARLLGVSFHIGLAAALTAETPKPFRIAGSVEVCVSVNLKFKKVSKCFTVSFTWDRDQTVDLTPVPLLGAAPGAAPIATGVHMHSARTYALEINQAPVAASQVTATVPLDTYVDIKFSKPVHPGASERIGGFTNPAAETTERLPPRNGSRVVTHSYRLMSVKVETWSAKKSAWVAYLPYVALAPEAVLGGGTAPPDPYDLAVGFWQKQDPTYSQIRLLALTPFSYMEPVGGYRPEQMGLAAETLFCVGHQRQQRCVKWETVESFTAGADHYRGGLMLRAEGNDAVALPFALPQLAPHSLAIAPGSRLILTFPSPVVQCRLALHSAAPHITVRYQRRRPLAASSPTLIPFQPPAYEDASLSTLQRGALVAPVIYDDAANPIDRIVIEPPAPDEAVIAALEDLLARLHEDWCLQDRNRRRRTEREIAGAQARLGAEHAKYCGNSPKDDARVIRTELARARRELEQLRAQVRRHAGDGGQAPAEAPRAAQTRGAARRLVDLQADIERWSERVAALEGGKRRNGAADRPSEGRREIPAGWECGTFLHEVCWLAEEDWTYNQTIPGFAAIEADFASMRAAAETIVAPIWRPDQIYRVTLTVSDTVAGPGAPVEAVQTRYVHFKTAGSIGYFGTQAPPGSGGADDQTQAQTKLEDPRPESPERFLKFYIDDERSTPDPSGNILYAKPAYYGDVKLRLFFAKPYAMHFFAEWPQYSAVKGASPDLDANKYEIEIRVKDPSETQAPATPLAADQAHNAPLVTAPLLGVQAWIEDPAPRRSEDIQALSNMRDPVGVAPGVTCWPLGGGPIKPAAKGLEVALNTLEPYKLYTAVIMNKHHAGGGVKEAEVARYPFMTSRYKNIGEHIGSYILAGRNNAERPAVFRLTCDLAAAGASVATAYANARSIVQGAAAPSAAFPDRFDQLLQECLKLDLPTPPISLEFNFLENQASKEVFALLIRSLEPINDPRIPLSERLGALRMSAAGAAAAPLVLFSRDCCQAVVMMPSGEVPTQDLVFEFDELAWNGASWTVLDSAATAPFSAP